MPRINIFPQRLEVRGPESPSVVENPDPSKTGMDRSKSAADLQALKREKSQDHGPAGYTRRLSWDDNWIHFGSRQNHTAEVMDFVDDSDNWSQASFESGHTFEGDSPNKPYRTLSLTTFGQRGSNVSLSSLDEAEEPQHFPTNAPDIQSKTGNLSAPAADPNNPMGSALLKDKRGMSNSMILNWLRFKKYPTIAENSYEGSPTPKADCALQAEGSFKKAMDSVAKEESGVASVPGPITAAVAAGPALDKTGRPKVFPSFRDLNAVAPTYW